MTRVGFIGLGRMGVRMAANLAADGIPLTVFNRTTQKAAGFTAQHGATVATTPRELAAESDVVITMVADGDALLAMYQGDDGVLAGLRPGVVAVEMSTVGPDLIHQLEPDVGATGATLVDAPVSGSVAAAENRGLMIMAGGPDESVAAIRPILESMGSPVIHVGPLGAGATMKLAINSIVFAENQAAAEALVMAERSGVDREVALDTIIASAAGAPVIKYRRDWFLRPDDMPVSFTIDLAVKDLELITGHAHHVGTTLPVAEEAIEVMRAAASDGFGSRDMGDVAVFMRDNAG